ncbi:hypothetical protein U1Q18_038855 [Sarracenia purpurea var. burkii]
MRFWRGIASSLVAEVVGPAVVLSRLSWCRCSTLLSCPTSNSAPGWPSALVLQQLRVDARDCNWFGCMVNFGCAYGMG